MKYIIKNANIFYRKSFLPLDILIENGRVTDVSSNIPSNGVKVFDFNNNYLFPGFTDVHVHLREPGFLYKETIKSATRAAAAGGYTAVCAMPNLNPVPDSLENLKVEKDAILKDAKIAVYPYGAITKGERGEELSDMEEISDGVIAFSDDGRGVQNYDMMFKAQENCAKLNKILAAHCEDESLLHGGVIHDGIYAKKHNLPGISSESEWRQIKRDLDIAAKTGCKYHVCHVSTKESVEIIRNAKKTGIDVTCETAPHYLVFSDADLRDDGRFKMNPPLRSEEDRYALTEAIQDGTIDMIATDHAPHSADEKSGGLRESLNGIVGLETAFPVLYTELVKKNVISLEKLICLMSVNPAERFFGGGGKIEKGEQANFAVWDLNKEYEIDSSRFFSKGKSTPFDGKKVFGRCLKTIYKGETVYERKC